VTDVLYLKGYSRNI